MQNFAIKKIKIFFIHIFLQFSRFRLFLEVHESHFPQFSRYFLLHLSENNTNI